MIQESRRAERAEQQRVRAEKERDRQTRIAVFLRFNIHTARNARKKHDIKAIIYLGGETEEGR